jgi:hypothetical protein
LWNASIQAHDSTFGIRTNCFGFNITGTADIPILVEACASLEAPVWTSMQSCTLTNGSIYFSDPTWTNSPTRFYHVRTP